MQYHKPHTLCRLGGAALCAGLILAAGSAPAATTYAVLYAFGEDSGGAYPKAGLISDSSGNFYGTTQFGGSGTACTDGCGTIFKLSPSGTLAVLYSFAGGTADGQEPASELIADSSGNLYGTTQAGGASSAGVVFKIAPDGTNYTVLHSFAGGLSDGARPAGDLIIDSLGNLYGTTLQGGPSGAGIVFELMTNGTLSLLYNFAGSSDGAFPYAGLYADSNSNLYGTTFSGGTTCNVCGLVFELQPDGFEKALHAFSGPMNDGSNPAARLIADSSGNLYGTTIHGGVANAGTVFKLSPGGILTVLHSFAGNSSDGAYPFGSLIADSNGNLYGTTVEGGAFGKGIVYVVSSTGTSFTVLYSFAGGATDGAYPWGDLIADSSGNLYGTASIQGPGGYGVIYELAGTGFTPQRAGTGFTPQRAPPP
jgi:uncharacterized repeat protein (TIGR03803 family)